jgi:sulfur carrier protein
MVTLNLNGEDRRFEAPLTIAELIASLRIKTSSIAVEVNRVIVPRSAHEAHRLNDGDRVEIVTFVGGG